MAKGIEGSGWTRDVREGAENLAIGATIVGITGYIGWQILQAGILVA